MDSLFVLDDSLDRGSQLVDGSVVEQDSAIDSNDVILNIWVEIPKIENLKTTTLARDLKQDLKTQVVNMTANFMNEIFELHSEIVGLKMQICERSNDDTMILYYDNLWW